jgi:hypothetical protein
MEKDMSVKLFLPLLIFVTQMVSPAPAQSDREFTDRVRNFKITLVSDWQPLTYSDAVGQQKTNFIFRNRNEGFLIITRENLSGRSLADCVKNDLGDLELNYACLYIGKEAFEGGQLSGLRATLCYMDDGRKVVGTFYYLQDGNMIWILRFKANPDSPGIALEITDKMARSFCTVCPIP